MPNSMTLRPACLARLLPACALLLVTGCARRQPTETATAKATVPESLTVYVGTYTSGGSEGIYRLSLDLKTGALRRAGVTPGIENPSFLALHPSRRFLYAVAEVEEMNGEKTGAVHAFAVDPASHDLKPLGHVPSRGGAPCHLSVDREGKNVLVANYVGGNVAVLPIADDGSLRPATGFVQHEGRGAHPRRQQRPHAHSINLDAQGRFAIVADLGLDRLLVYGFDARTGTLRPNDPPYTALPPGTGPRHFAFHPNGKFAFANGELTSDVTALLWDGTRGTLAPLNTVSTLPADYTGGNSTAEVTVHPNGRFVYVSNRGHDSIAVFAVGDDGQLTTIGYTKTSGETPRNFAIDPTGTYLVAANQKTGNLVSFRLDPQSGMPVPTGHAIEVPAPVCVRYLY